MTTLKHILAATTITLVVALSCQKKPETNEVLSPALATDPEVITLTNEQKKQAGIKVGALEQKQLFQQVQANGYFDVPPQNRAQVSAYKAGYVKNTALLVGDQVKKGQLLVVMENPDYVHLQQNFMEVKGQLDYLKSEYERKKILEEEHITARKNLLKAEADYKSALARYSGMKKELQMMGIDVAQVEAGQISSTISMRAPIAGNISQVNAVIGKYVNPTEVLFEIVDTEHMHLELSIYEKDVAKIKVKQKMKVKVPSLGEGFYAGELYLVGKTFDAETRTLNVHGHMEEEAAFLPGMYAEATVAIDSKVVNALPEQAVVSQGEDRFIFLERETTSDGSVYQKVPVQTGLQSDGWIEIMPLEKLAEGAKVVVEGTYYLSSGFETAD